MRSDAHDQRHARRCLHVEPARVAMPAIPGERASCHANSPHDAAVTPGHRGAPPPSSWHDDGHGHSAGSHVETDLAPVSERPAHLNDLVAAGGHECHSPQSRVIALSHGLGAQNSRVAADAGSAESRVCRHSRRSESAQGHDPRGDPHTATTARTDSGFHPPRPSVRWRARARATCPSALPPRPRRPRFDRGVRLRAATRARPRRRSRSRRSCARRARPRARPSSRP